MVDPIDQELLDSGCEDVLEPGLLAVGAVAVLDEDAEHRDAGVDGVLGLEQVAGVPGEVEVPGDAAGRLDSNGFSNVDVFAGLRNDTWSLNLFLKNAFDEDGVMSRRPVGEAYNELTLIPERTFGVTASYRF